MLQVLDRSFGEFPVHEYKTASELKTRDSIGPSLRFTGDHRLTPPLPGKKPLARKPCCCSMV